VGGLDPAKIFILLVIALIVVGPERLPGAARQLGGAWRELNRLREKFETEVRAIVPDLDLPNIPTSPSKAVSGYISGLVSGLGDSTTTAASTTAAVSDAAGSDSAESFTPTARTWSRRASAQPEQSWQPLLGRQEHNSPRRPAAMPSWSGAGTQSADARSADTVFVFDDPSMN
jgi:Sec-independent protein translocase protein TatA